MHMDETRLVEIALYETALDDFAMDDNWTGGKCTG
jgi:hypothetical protein